VDLFQTKKFGVLGPDSEGLALGTFWALLEEVVARFRSKKGADVPTENLGSSYWASFGTVEPENSQRNW
jgi:hypothetical protein